MWRHPILLLARDLNKIGYWHWCKRRMFKDSSGSFWITATLSKWNHFKGKDKLAQMVLIPRWILRPEISLACLDICVCVLQPTRIVCQIWCSPWRRSGWWAPATTRAWAGCAPRVGACWGGTTSTPGPLVCSILYSLCVCDILKLKLISGHFF